jgi:hypothetical protein
VRFPPGQPFWQKRDYAWFVMQPRRRYTASELAAMKAHAEPQLGRPYMLRGRWQEREVRGILCSQLVANVIDKSGLIHSADFRESPGSLRAKLAPCYAR